MPKICKPEYLAKVQLLNKEETERLLSRMSGKLASRLEKDKLSKEDALAIQLELEEEQLQQWRKMMRVLHKKDKVNKEVKTDKEAKPKVAAKAKAEIKEKAPLKEKALALKKGAAPKTAKVEQSK